MEKRKNAGFIIRLLASWIDFFFIFILLKLVFYLFLILSINVYFPFEFTFLISVLAYSIVSLGLFGKTLGKYLLNLEVVKINDHKLSFIGAIFRESIFKIISTLVFFLGFIWIGFSSSRRGWHDYIGGTKVIVSKPLTPLNRVFKVLAVISLLFVLGSFLSEIFYGWNFGRKVQLTEQITHPYHQHSVSDLREISDITAADDTLFANWLGLNGTSPAEYAIEAASNHRITIFGEYHFINSNLDLLNKIIPDLYFESGIRCIAMEAISASMNKKLQKLINSEEYNEVLALEIARNSGWPDWGYQGYWDVLNTVWTLNRNLSKEDEPMCLVGIDSDWNGAALALMGVGDNKVRGVPIWEKFRVLTVIGDLMKINFRDEIMARNVVEEIINKGDKGIIWIGTNHSYTHYGQPIVLHGNLIAEKNRMGVILSNKYKDEVFQIVLHSDFSDSKNMDIFFKRAVYDRNLAPVAFTTKDSPFAHLRDSSNYFFRHQPEVAFRDLAEGYIFIKPQSEFEYCEWTDNYVSQKMFLKYKPFFEAKHNQRFKSADAINSYMKETSMK